jgi:hypothetical protein
MFVDRNRPLRLEINGVDYIVSFGWPSDADDTPNKVTVSSEDKIIYQADIEAGSQMEAEQIAVDDLRKYLQKRS